MAEDLPPHITQEWAHRMASMARAAMGEPSPEAQDEAVSYVSALENALVVALRTIERLREPPKSRGH